MQSGSRNLRICSMRKIAGHGQLCPGRSFGTMWCVEKNAHASHAYDQTLRVSESDKIVAMYLLTITFHKTITFHCVACHVACRCFWPGGCSTAIRTWCESEGEIANGIQRQASKGELDQLRVDANHVSISVLFWFVDNVPFMVLCGLKRCPKNGTWAVPITRGQQFCSSLFKALGVPVETLTFSSYSSRQKRTQPSAEARESLALTRPPSNSNGGWKAEWKRRQTPKISQTMLVLLKFLAMMWLPCPAT